MKITLKIQTINTDYLLKTNYFTGKTSERDLTISTLQLDVKLFSQLE
jgi:hypothetical protein